MQGVVAITSHERVRTRRVTGVKIFPVEPLGSEVDRTGYDFRKIPDYKIFPSEDFALVSEQVKSTYLLLFAKKEDNHFPHHSPFVDFDEAALPFGAAIYAQCATQWLNHH